MATPINIEDAWQISPNRNNNIPFNYVYDKQLERWVPETKETSIKFDVVSANGNNGAVDVEFNIALLS